MILTQDIETNGFDPDTIHVICTKERETGVTHSFTDMSLYAEYIKDTKPSKHVFHNGLAFDVKVINRLIEPNLIDPKDVIDTMVVSKLTDYTKYNTHSLAEIGKDIGVYKGDYTGGWDICTQDMIDYCEQDVEVTEAILNRQWKYITDPQWASSMRTEHDIAALCEDMSIAGFKFDSSLALNLLDEVSKEMDELEDSFRTSFPSKLVEVKRVKLRYTKDGELYANIKKDIDAYPKVEVEKDEVIVYDYKEFSPGSPRDRIDVLWEAGWKPFEKTKGHNKFLRSKRRW